LVNPLNAKLNPICHLLALLGAHHILHVSRIRVKIEHILAHQLPSKSTMASGEDSRERARNGNKK